MDEDVTIDIESLTESGKRTRMLRSECIDLLGRYRDEEGEIRTDPRCKNPDCGWLNHDGTKGCNDKLALQFDHIGGDGSRQRTAGTIMGNRLYYAIKKQPQDFQLLCANCNEIKSKREKLGARLHKRPQLVRRSQQIDGQPLRRAKTAVSN